MNKKLVIIGAGGHAKVVLDTALSMQRWPQIVLLDDTASDGLFGCPLLGGTALLGSSILPDEYEVAVAIGNNPIRARYLEQAAGLGFNRPVIQHPGASVSRFAEIGDGTVLFAQSAVNAAARLGEGCIVNTAATIDHDCRIGRFVHISPGAHLAGATEVGDYSWLGIGSCTRQGIRIGRNCTVGAGAAVVADVSDDLTVAGVPAKKLRKTEC